MRNSPPTMEAALTLTIGGTQRFLSYGDKGQGPFLRLNLGCYSAFQKIDFLCCQS